jgi:hypothetical protein
MVLAVLLSFKDGCYSRAKSTPPNQEKLKWDIDADESDQPQFLDQG